MFGKRSMADLYALARDPYALRDVVKTARIEKKAREPDDFHQALDGRRRDDGDLGKRLRTGEDEEALGSDVCAATQIDDDTLRRHR